MKVVVSTTVQAHMFHLARELNDRGALARFYTGYPHFKLGDKGIPRAAVRTFPWLIAPYMGFPWHDRIGIKAFRQWEYLNRVTLDRYVARRMEDCDVFVGLSSAALESGKRIQSMGGRFVLDRGCTHIGHQDDIVAEEHALWKQPHMRIDPRTIALEEAEYALADGITVPSSLSRRTFIERGVPAEKIHVLPYGVNLADFYPSGQPSPDHFDVLFAGGANLRKGIPYLLQAFQKFKHPAKRLWFAGSMPESFVEMMRGLGLWSDDYNVLGHLSQAELRNRMSKSHVMVLPSVEEGLALVQAQALACGCPVIATENTGAIDLFDDGDAGFILPVRRPDLILDRLQALADEPELRSRLSQGALNTVTRIGGWKEYGNKASQIYKNLLAA